MNIPMSSPDLTEAEIAAVNRVLNTPVLSLGPQIEAFEKACAAYVGVPYGIGVNSGTSGLHLCVIAAGVGEGDLVITTPFSFVASANCILYERATPIFVDVDPRTGNIDPALVAECAHDLTHGGHPERNPLSLSKGAKSKGHPERSRGGAKSKDARRWIPRSLWDLELGVGRLSALLPVHAFGQPADMDLLTAVAEQHGLAVIEDACEAIGAEYKQRKVGMLGDAAVYAFYPNKQMTTGEGGLIVTDRGEWDALFRSLRNQGRDVFDAWLNHTRLGYNYRLDEMSAALGLAQLGRIDELLAKRERVAGWYNERLANVEWIERPYVAPTTTRMSWFVYVVRVKPPANREAVMKALAEDGIPSRPYFTPIHLQPFYAERFGYKRGDFPVTESLGDMSLALPFSGVMSEEQVEHVCERLRSHGEGAPRPAQLARA